jgi:PAS domain S-box-containing protein
MNSLPPPRLNPFERIKSTEGKVFLLLCGLGAIALLFDAFAPGATLDSRWRTLQIAVMLLYIGVGTFGTMRIVARPVRRAKRYFSAIAAGDYSHPVLTRRTDEFGDMLRGLENMRQHLVSAIAARDEAERKYRVIVERSVQGFYQGTEDGELLAANPALARMLGYGSPAELLAEPAGIAKQLHVDAARREAFIREMRAHGVVTAFESRLRRRDGSIVWVSENALAVNDGRGRVYWEGFLDDITARKETEQLKSDFVAFVTHQLRTPLSGIRWMLELAQQSDLSPETASYLDDAHASARRLIDLVNDLLDVARLEAGRIVTEAKPIDLAAITTELLDDVGPLAAAKRLAIERRSSTTRAVLGDPQLIRQALMNLLSNALKYTPEGGRVVICSSAEGDEVLWSVQDTGIGVPPAAQRRLFEKFYRADNAQVIDTEGTGLGLYLVRLIAERCGGSVGCESIENGGSTFTLRLPATTQQEAAA